MKRTKDLLCLLAAFAVTLTASFPLLRGTLRSEAKETVPASSVMQFTQTEAESTTEEDCMTEGSAREESMPTPIAKRPQHPEPEAESTGEEESVTQAPAREENLFVPCQQYTTPAPGTTTKPVPPATTYVPIIPAPTEPAPAVRETDLSFTVHSVRVGCRGVKDFPPRGSVIADRAALEALLMPSSEDNTYNQTLPESLQEVLTRYDETWFRSHRLLLLEIRAGSGSYRHVVDRVERTADGAHVEFHRQCPQVCTCDVADWFLFIGVDDTTLRTDDVVTAEKTRDVMSDAKPWVGSGPSPDAEPEYRENDDWKYDR